MAWVALTARPHSIPSPAHYDDPVPTRSQPFSYSGFRLTDVPVPRAGGRSRRFCAIWVRGGGDRPGRRFLFRHRALQAGHFPWRSILGPKRRAVTSP